MSAFQCGVLGDVRGGGDLVVSVSGIVEVAALVLEVEAGS